MSSANASSDTQAGQMPANGSGLKDDGALSSLQKAQRKKVVVVGLGMVGIAFM